MALFFASGRSHGPAGFSYADFKDPSLVFDFDQAKVSRDTGSLPADASWAQQVPLNGRGIQQAKNLFANNAVEV